MTKKYEIRHRETGAVIFACEANSLGEAVSIAIARGISLAGSNLAVADLSFCFLNGADFSGADLYKTDFTGAKFTGAYLASPKFDRTNLDKADLAAIRADFHAVLDVAPDEVPGLRDALLAGRIDGTYYEGECRCLVGTIAGLQGVAHDEIPGLTPYDERPAEAWFLPINPGDTPETSPFARITLGWLDAWLAPAPAPVAAGVAP